MRIDTSSITACLVLMMMTLAVSVTARPRSLRQIARIMQREIKEKTPMAFSKRTGASEEIQSDVDKGQVLAKLLGLEAVGTDERRLKPNPFSAELLDSSRAPRHGETGPLRSDESTNETSQGKTRVRRRCSAGQWPCEVPTDSSQISLIAADSAAEGTDSQTVDEAGIGGVLDTLPGLEEVQTSKSKHKANPFSSELSSPSDAFRPRSKELPLSSQASTKGSGQAKRRVRRRCFPGQWPCPTGSSS